MPNSAYPGLSAKAASRSARHVGDSCSRRQHPARSWLLASVRILARPSALPVGYSQQEVEAAGGRGAAPRQTTKRKRLMRD